MLLMPLIMSGLVEYASSDEGEENDDVDPNNVNHEVRINIGDSKFELTTADSIDSRLPHQGSLLSQVGSRNVSPPGM